MKKNILYMAALAIMAAACTSEDDTFVSSPEKKGDVKMITETVRAFSGDNSTTRVTVDAGALSTWTTGDLVAVHVDDGKYYTTDALAAGGSDDAEFNVTYPDANARDAFAIFPANIVTANAANYGQEGATLDVTLPATYTLAELSGTTTPCPAIATNEAGSDWEFKQLCGLLRLTVSNIPSTAKRLEISFDGKKVCGDFSIASPVTPGTSAIQTSEDADNDKIVVTNDGTDVALGSTELVLNFPLPTGTYTNISVVAYDAISGGMPLLMAAVPFPYEANRARGVKRTADLQTNFKITIKDDATKEVMTGLRFVRMFSSQNKLHNAATTYGPLTMSTNGNPDVENPIEATLFFDNNPEDEIVFQVIDADGKVYAGSMDAPEGGYVLGKSYEVEVEVKAYTFTVAPDKKVYFSPGDLGVDNGVYSFTEPFTNWSGTVTNVTTVPSQRSWFDYTEIDEATDPATQLYGITWRIEGRPSASSAYEWLYLLNTRTMNGVNRYYKVTVGSHANCLLLPPDEAVAGDIATDLPSGPVTDYLKYLAKGFVLLMDAKQGTFTDKKISWSNSYYAYWTVYDNKTNRKQLQWTSTRNPDVNWPTNQFRLHVRLIHDAN
jgi:hypothetical protein